MKYIKRLIPIIIVGFIIIIIGYKGKGQELPQKIADIKKKTIGVCMANFNDQYQVDFMYSMKEAQNNLKDFDVIYMNGKYDPQVQISQIEYFIDQQVDAIVLFPADLNAAKIMVEKIETANIPLITINSKVNSPYVDSYVGSNHIESGEIQAKETVRLLGGRGNIAVIAGTYGHIVTNERLQGYKNILKDYPEINIVAESPAEWVRDKGMRVMESWIQSNLEIDAVLANNDEMALGAVKAIKDAGLGDKIVISGVDATLEALHLVKIGELKYTILQNAKLQAEKAIEVATMAANGEKVEKEYIIPFELVTQENVDVYINKYK